MGSKDRAWAEAASSARGTQATQATHTARLLTMSSAEFSLYVQRKLAGNPCLQHNPEATPALLPAEPDILVRRERGRWTVQLNPVVVPRVRLNPEVAQPFGRGPGEDGGVLASQLLDARWTLRNLELRSATIVQVASAIVRRQQAFFDSGEKAMRPLALRDVAEDAGVHESTVSRTIGNKFMATPRGVFELRHFFSRALIGADGSACSAMAIRGLIKDIVEAEHPAKPWTDADIARQLRARGVTIARRTVSKYRQMLLIDAVEQRRCGTRPSGTNHCSA